MSKRILFVHNYYQIGGGEHTVFENEKQLLEDAGHFVVPYTRANDELKGSLIKLLLLPFTTIFSLRTYREVRRLIREQRIDLVHCHNTFPLISPAVYYAAWRMGVPVVQTIHNFRLVCPSGLCFRDGAVCEECLERKGFGPALRHRCYRGSWLQTAVAACMLRVHRILGTYRRLNCIFLTEFNRDKIAPLLRLPPERQFIKPNFCFQRATACGPQEVDRNKFIYVGRLDDYKGILLLARLWQSLPQEYILRIYGEGPLEEELAALAAEHSGIQLAGFQEQETVFEDWRTACALVFPSICYEGLPMTPLESFSMGVPVLVNNMGNHGALVGEGKTGFHFSLSALESLKSAIQQVCEKQEALKKACLEAYQRNYAPQVVLQEQERIYEAGQGRDTTSKRILFVHNYYQIGGGEHTVFENERQLLEDAGHFVFPYTRTNDELKGSLIKLLLLPLTTIFSLRTYREVKRLIREQGIDLVHCHNTFPLISPAVYYAAWRMGVPVVQTIHNFRLVCPSGLCFRDGAVCEECLERKGFGPALRHRCYRGSWLQTAVAACMLRVHRILGTYRRLNCIFLTEFNRDKIAPLLRLPQERQFIKPNFCFQRATACAPKEVDRNKFIYVGRLDSNKGILLLARLWQALPQEYILRIYGEGPLGEELAALAAEHPNIQLAGFQAQNVFFEDWRTACALVFPSIWYEGLPMTLLESFSMGVPVLVNNMGNHGVLVDEGKTGVHFFVSDLESLKAAIERVRGNQEKWKESCLEAYQQHYTPQMAVQEQERIYEAVVSGAAK